MALVLYKKGHSNGTMRTLVGPDFRGLQAHFDRLSHCFVLWYLTITLTLCTVFFKGRRCSTAAQLFRLHSELLGSPSEELYNGSQF